MERRRRISGLAVALVVVACGGESTSDPLGGVSEQPDGGGVEPADAGAPPPDVSVMGQCGTYSGLCANGAVIVEAPDCSGYSAGCAQGCRSDGVTMARWPVDRGLSLCEENRPRRAGDLCTTHLDCAATYDPYGSSTEAILRCDPATGRCVAGASVPGHNGACGISPPDLPTGSRAVVLGELCGEGVCLLKPTAIDPSNTWCVSQCVTDRDCSQLTPVCADVPIYPVNELRPRARVCVPVSG